MEEQIVSLRKDIVISFLLDSFFCLTLLLYGISSLIGGNISPLAIISLIIGIFQSITIRNIFENIKSGEIQKVNSNFNLIGIINLVISVILYLLVLLAIFAQYLMDPAIGLDTLILYVIYYTAIFLGLGFISGIYSLITSRRSL